MDRWAGRVAVVTGASSGIGAAIVRELVRQGITVVGLARRDDRIKAMAAELKCCPGKLYAVRTDLRKEDEIVSAFCWVKANLGSVGILINNAGLAVTTVATEGDMAAWRNMFDVNVFAVGICTREALKSMRAHQLQDGHIINIGSVIGHKPCPVLGVWVYSATKHALRILTDGMRKELIEGHSKIKITSISPGLVDTEFSAVANVPPDPRPHLDAEEVAKAVVFALSTAPTTEIVDMLVQVSGDWP